ncbi:Putative thiazole biosynthetic enzyme [Ephemeroptericola cinctiostellae]|uniref:Thiazole biosynthetic enzyme n=1 Tax=Ephemeroptericola cinctiostellae TaxID=2268024 RepID=A0A345DB32_9BURK|nr:TIGR03862 family flavoprotein [Ephemeroptericola cinctiostellae]AXF85570.1 Putative thiazole biosynthetic enzyme [Ephemeroptericola cinctiostellae]
MQTDLTFSAQPTITIIGAGPAGLMAAEVLSSQGHAVTVYDAMPSVGRKFLLAGIGGMNITHSESLSGFLSRFQPCSEVLLDSLRAFDNQAVVSWVEGLGLKTFVGSSGRVFPTDMKAAPLLRVWLARLRDAGVRFEMRHRWLGWNDEGHCVFEQANGRVEVQSAATVLALGGASWPKLGSDAQWCPWLTEKGVSMTPLQASNCGFDVAAWSQHLIDKWAGRPIKPVTLRIHDAHTDAMLFERQGEMILTATGMEGGLMYAANRCLRDMLNREGVATMKLDLLPQHSFGQVLREVTHPRGSRSMSSHLSSRLGLTGVKTALLFEILSRDDWADLHVLARMIKALPIQLTATRPVAEAISSAGGVSFSSMNAHLMLNQLPGVFCAGEMLDWDAPTGGYLLTACLATGRAAGEGVAAWLAG